MSIKTQMKSATVVADAEGRQYHINAAPGEMANKVLLFGDPKRVKIAASFFESVTFETENRGYSCVTGLYKGQKISAMGTGIGPASTEIALMELFQITQAPVLLRIGTSGGLQSFINPGDFVITTGALGFEDTYTRYVYDNYPPVAHHEIVSELIKQAKHTGVAYHPGLTASTASFYAGQGRAISDFPIRNKTLVDDLEKMRVCNFEMESSTVLTLGALNNSKAGCMCIAVNNRHQDVFITPELMKQREVEAVKLGLETLLNIYHDYHA